MKDLETYTGSGNHSSYDPQYAQMAVYDEAQLIP